MDKVIRFRRGRQDKSRFRRQKGCGCMTAGNRISLIIKVLGITKKKFADSLDISSGNLSDWINPLRKSNPTAHSLTRINELYNVDITWLLTGKGEMFITNREDISTETCQILHVESDIAAGEPVEATGQRLDSFNIGYSFIQNVNDYYCFRVNGRSMEPDIKNEDLIIIKKDNNWNDKDNVVCAVRIDGDITLKRISHDPKKKMIILSSDNKEYTPIVVDPKHADAFMIGCLYLVVRRVE